MGKCIFLLDISKYLTLVLSLSKQAFVSAFKTYCNVGLECSSEVKDSLILGTQHKSVLRKYAVIWQKQFDLEAWPHITIQTGGRSARVEHSWRARQRRGLQGWWPEGSLAPE